MTKTTRPDFRSTEVAGRILRQTKTIAVVGLSPSPDRVSHGVASYLQRVGFRIVPIHPKAEEILGETCYPRLADVPDEVDTVCLFRRPEFVLGHVKEAIAAGAKAVWGQIGVVDEAAAESAHEAGLLVVMDRCMKVDHASGLGGQS